VNAWTTDERARSLWQSNAVVRLNELFGSNGPLGTSATVSAQKRATARTVRDALVLGHDGDRAPSSFPDERAPRFVERLEGYAAWHGRNELV
jgi:hypothetical protein